jgi:hypothetical protein
VDTRHADTAKDSGRRVGPRPVPKRPAAHSRAMVVLAHDSSHMPFPSCSKLHTRTHSQARTHGASNCQRGIYVSLPCERAHAATPSASQHVSKHPTGRHGSGGIPAASGSGPSASPASEAMCHNAAPLPSRRARSSTGWPTFRAAQALAARPARAVIPLASSGKRARFRTYTLRRGRR